MATEIRPPEPCTAYLQHGPGHQSKTFCFLRGRHEIHQTIYGSAQQSASWRGPSATTGFFDEPPEARP